MYTRFWRPGLLLLMVIGSLVFLATRAPFGQDPRYHYFADDRAFLGIPNFLDVASNVPFLLVGLAGLGRSLRGRFAGASVTWAVFFAGVTLVTAGSAYYHWRPSNATLVWDRLPMTIGFMAMFVALLGESLGAKLERVLLPPALLVGFSSVVYWHVTDDLRFYAWVQLLPLITIPAVMALFRSRYSHQALLLVALACYFLAKATEAYDREIFALTNRTIGGHAVKHLLAGAGGFAILVMLGRRSAVQSSPSPSHPRAAAG